MNEQQPAATWRDRIDEVAPSVLIIGGFMSSPPLYRGLRDLLLERGAADVLIAPIWTPDWMLATARGQGPVATRAGRALLQASEASAASPASAGAPVLVVGHSAGGVIARILTAPEPFAGRAMNGSGRIGAIVTLGSPHVMGDHAEAERPSETSRWAAEHVPGTLFAPRTGYLAVGSRAVVGDPDGDGKARTAYRFYGGVLEGTDDGPVEGDGLIPLASTLLPGAECIVFDDALHGFFVAGAWYGDAEHVDAWWPRAIAIWRDALRARVARPAVAHGALVTSGAA
jgi:hypothetical protein